MASNTQSQPGGRPVILTLPCNPPSAASSVYAESEASTDTFTGMSLATNSTLGEYIPPVPSTESSYVPRTDATTLPANPITHAPLPLLQLEDGDTLLYLTPTPSAITPELASSRLGHTHPPLRVKSQCLRNGSPVLAQLLGESMQRRFLTRLVRQKKLVLPNDRLPPGILYVLDLTPEDEGDRAVEWQEKLWCPDEALTWKSTLDPPPPPISPLSETAIEDRLEEFRKRAWGGDKPAPEEVDTATGSSSSGAGMAGPTGSPALPASPVDTKFRPLGQKTDLPPIMSRKTKPLEGYDYGRHILALERLVHILHGMDPIVQSTVDWYTLHALSVAFGTTDATRDYIAKWIYIHYPIIVETHPQFIWKVSVEAGIPTIASDAWSAAIMKFSSGSHIPSGLPIPGIIEGMAAMQQRAASNWLDLSGLDWVDQYLPFGSSPNLENFKLNLKSYIKTGLKRALGTSYGVTDKPWGNITDTTQCGPYIMKRGFWRDLLDTQLAAAQGNHPPVDANISECMTLETAVKCWNDWEKETDEMPGAPTDDLWRDVKAGVPQYPVASVTQNTGLEAASIDDARSEILTVGGAGTEEGGDYDNLSIHDDSKSVVSLNDDVRSVASSTHTLNNAMNALSTEQPGPSTTSLDTMKTAVEEPTFVKPPKPFVTDEEDEDEKAPFQMELGDDDNSTVMEDDGSLPFQELKPRPAEPEDRSHPDTPFWLRSKLQALSATNKPAQFWAVMHHPMGDYSKPAEPRVRCFDCPDMLYFPGPGESLTNFLVHLRNIRHLNRVSTRQRAENEDYLASWNEEKRSRAFLNPPAKPAYQSMARKLEIPNEVLTILRQCETHIKAHTQEMTAINVNFEPEVLEDHISCFEEFERRHMPVWAGGEVIETSGSGATNRGVEDTPDNMTVNVSTIGVGSVATASTADSFAHVDYPGSISSASIISGPEDDLLMSGSEDELPKDKGKGKEKEGTTADKVMTDTEEEDDDDWDMGEEDEFDDDVYFG